MAARSPVLRNALILVGAQLAGTPLSLLVNAMMGRYLGAEAFGHLFLATTLTRLGFLFVDWGHSGVLPAAVARDRSVASQFLGTSLVWRFATSVLVVLALAGGSWALGYGLDFQVVLGLIALQWILNTVAAACQDTIKGFERTDVAASAQLGQQVLTALIVIPALLLGGRLTASLVGQVVAAAIVTLLVWRVARRIVIDSLSVSRRAWNELFGQGTYFLSFGIAMALQANVDAILLDKLTSTEVVGWQAAAQRLAGVLLIPAGALISALYPTLARLHVEDHVAYVDTVRRALRGTVVLAVPMAAACALYRELGIELFSKAAFGPAEKNLLVMSVLILLVYVSMPVGTALMAAGRQRAWAGVQILCVAVSVGLDPLLIPWFQKHYGNGGIGVCVAGVVSEIIMVGTGLTMMKRGVIDRSLVLVIGKATLAGALMIGVGLMLGRVTPFVAAPLSFLAYAGSLWVIGGVDRSEIQTLKDGVLRRFKR